MKELSKNKKGKANVFEISMDKKKNISLRINKLSIYNRLKIVYCVLFSEIMLLTNNKFYGTFKNFKSIKKVTKNKVKRRPTTNKRIRR